MLFLPIVVLHESHDAVENCRLPVSGARLGTWAACGRQLQQAAPAEEPLLGPLCLTLANKLGIPKSVVSSFVSTVSRCVDVTGAQNTASESSRRCCASMRERVLGPAQLPTPPAADFCAWLRNETSPCDTISLLGAHRLPACLGLLTPANARHDHTASRWAAPCSRCAPALPPCCSLAPSQGMPPLALRNIARRSVHQMTHALLKARGVPARVSPAEYGLIGPDVNAIYRCRNATGVGRQASRMRAALLAMHAAAAPSIHRIDFLCILLACRPWPSWQASSGIIVCRHDTPACFLSCCQIMPTGGLTPLRDMRPLPAVFPDPQAVFEEEGASYHWCAGGKCSAQRVPGPSMTWARCCQQLYSGGLLAGSENKLAAMPPPQAVPHAGQHGAALPMRARRLQQLHGRFAGTAARCAAQTVRSPWCNAWRPARASLLRVWPSWPSGYSGAQPCSLRTCDHRCSTKLHRPSHEAPLISRSEAQLCGNGHPPGARPHSKCLEHTVPPPLARLDTAGQCQPAAGQRPGPALPLCAAQPGVSSAVA